MYNTYMNDQINNNLAGATMNDITNMDNEELKDLLNTYVAFDPAEILGKEKVEVLLPESSIEREQRNEKILAEANVYELGIGEPNPFKGKYSKTWWK